jgi:hypothetical protein
MPATATPTDYGTLRSWLYGNQAVAKAAGTLPEKEDGGEKATEGERSSENSADVKKLMPGVNVEVGKTNPETGNADKPVPDSGLAQGMVGSMPEVEKAVKTVTEENEKASSADLTTDAGFIAAFEALTKSAAALGVLSTAAAGVHQTPNHTPNQPAKSAAATTTQNTEPSGEAVVAGYMKMASDRADLVGNYMQGMYTTYNDLVKAAADGSLDQMMDAGGGGGDPAAGGAPPPEAGDAAPPPPDAGPAPAGAGPGGAGGGAPSVEDLASALTEMGVSPDELMEVAQKMKSSVGGAPDASMPPEEKAAAIQGLDTTIKFAGDAKTMMRAGKFRLKPAADDSPERKRRDTARNYISELFNVANA